MRERKGKLSLCWDCEVTDCEWIRKGDPVEGWKIKTEKRDRKDNYGSERTQILKCPKYKKMVTSEGKKISEKIWQQMDNFYFNTGELFDLLEIGIKEYTRISVDMGIKDLEDYFDIKIKLNNEEGFKLTKIDKKR